MWVCKAQKLLLPGMRQGWKAPENALFFGRGNL